MAEFPHLVHAPIQEALIDFRVEHLISPAKGRFEAFGERLALQYPRKQELRLLQAQVTFSEGDVSNNQSTSFRGIRLDSDERHFVVQAQTDGLTVSRLAPYLDWEELVSEAKAVWQLYVELVDPSTVVRVATRFINRFAIPGERIELDDYFRTLPKVPALLPQALSGFFVNIQIPDSSKSHTISLTQAMEVEVDKDQVFLVDIDVFRATMLDTRSAEVWSILSMMRQAKNETFFAVLSDKAIGLFR